MKDFVMSNNATRRLVLAIALLYLFTGGCSSPTAPLPTPPETLTVATPSFDPAAGTYTEAQSVTVSSATVGATIRFTTDGSDPTESTGTVYTAPVAVGENQTIKAIAFKTDLTTSAIATTAYVIDIAAATVETPTFDIAAGTYPEIQTVTITSVTAGAVIYYTVDGTDPTELAGTPYTAPVNVAETLTLKAIATKSEMVTSAIASTEYVINLPSPVAAPILSPAGGTYENTQTVAISSATVDATIHFTTDGSEPTELAGTVYTAPLTVSETQTIKALAFKAEMTTTAVVTAEYTITGPSTAMLYDWKVTAMSARHSGAWAAPTGEVFVVGNRFMNVYSGFDWQYEPVSDYSFTALHGTSTNNIYSSGSTGSGQNAEWTIRHFNGSTWNDSFYESYPLTDVFAADSSVFVAKYYGCRQYDGTSWKSYAVGTNAIFYGVFARSADEAYMVGDRGAYAWDGTAWSDMNLANAVTLQAVHGAPGGNHLFAVGSYGYIYRWDGTTWLEMTTGTTANINDVHAISDTDVYAVGSNGTILHYDGTSWTKDAFSSSQTFYAIAINSNQIVATGSGGLIAQKTSGGWSTPYTPLHIAPYGIGGISETDMWAVGGGGKASHFNGSFWTPVDTGATNNIRGVMAFATDDVWFVGDQSSVWHWDGASFSFNQLGTSRYLSGIWGAAPDDMWAGDFSHWDGTSWTQIPPAGVYHDMTTIWGTASDNVYGVGANVDNGFAATIYHWDGSEWTLIDLGKNANMAGIWGTGPNDIFAATQKNGDIFHFDGTSWTEMVSPYTPLMTSISGVASNNVFAVGTTGVMFHYDGISWQPYDSGFAANFNKLVMFSETAGAAVSYGNTTVISYGP